MKAARQFKTRLKEVLNQEQQLAAEEQAAATALSVAALEARGCALRDLKVSATDSEGIELFCSSNSSKFREGDTVVLISGRRKLKARIRYVTDGGRRLNVACRAFNHIGSPITMIESGDDISAVFGMALNKLVSGAPGWWLLEALAGSDRGKNLLEACRLVAPEEVTEQLYADVEIDSDETFHNALTRCLARPRMFAVQGPPGTGKTVLLALVAEGFARQGLRVAVTTYTHQAVNNALSIIHELFPQRRVVKLGSGIRREGLSDDIPCIVLKDEFGGGESEILDATIFGLTFASATIELSIQNSLFTPHIVLVDEAGQLPLAYSASMGLMGASSYLLFGDDRQMPPVFRGDTNSNPDMLSVFAFFRRLYPEHVCQLEMTHRLNAELCSIVSRVFYEEAGLSGIKPSPLAAKRRFAIKERGNATEGSKALHSPSSLIWIDSPSGNFRERNEWEANRSVEIIEEALAGGLKSYEMAVIAPFRRQVALIRAKLSKKLGGEQAIPIVDTVERLQGMTVELIVVSATAADPEYVSAVGDFLFSVNRLNVSVSRARAKAIVMGSLGLWDAVPETMAGLEGQRVWNRFRSLALKNNT